MSSLFDAFNITEEFRNTMYLKTKGKTKLANSMALLTSVSIVVSVALLKSFGASNFVLIIFSTASFLYWIPILLNYLGIHVKARLVQIIFSNVLIFLMSILFDRGTCFDYYYMVMIGLPLIFFDNEIGNWKWVLAGSTLPLWALTLHVSSKFEPLVFLEPSIVFSLQVINNVLQFLFLAAMFHFFSRVTQDYVAKLEKQKKDLEDTNIELDDALLKANEAAVSKSMFMANMSHEIRTPLNGVILAGHMLKSDLKGEQKDAAEVILESGNNLLSIVNDILDFSKIEANKMLVDREIFDLSRCFQQVLNPLKIQCSHKGIDLEFVLASNVPAQLIGDELRLKQILTNLLGNAVKFTDEGKVVLRVESEESTTDGSVNLQVHIEDSGKGISPENLDVIFESFTQEDGSTNRTYGGTGLGTTISKMLVELMGGEIKANSPNPRSSEVGGPGSVFSFSIDFEVYTSENPVGDSLKSSKPELTNVEELQAGVMLESANRAKILVADDNLINQKVARMLFEKLGHSIEIVDNGKCAVARALEEQFDVIFMDYMMPEMDGLEATSVLRSREIQTPIIAMTANAHKHDKEQCLEAGMNDYLSKPVNIDKLKTILDKWLDKKVG